MRIFLSPAHSRSANDSGFPYSSNPWCRTPRSAIRFSGKKWVHSLFAYILLISYSYDTAYKLNQKPTLVALAGGPRFPSLVSVCAIPACSIKQLSHPFILPFRNLPRTAVSCIELQRIARNCLEQWPGEEGWIVLSWKIFIGGYRPARKNSKISKGLRLQLPRF